MKATWKDTIIAESNDTNEDAAWYYPEPGDIAKNIKGRIAFWRGVRVTE